MIARATAVDASEPQKPYWSDQLFWFILALGFVFGGLFNFLPASFSTFKNAFNLSFQELGKIQLFFFSGGLFFTLIGGWFVNSVGFRAAASSTLVLLACALLLAGSASNSTSLLIAAFCFGAAIASLVVTSNSMIADAFPDKRQSVFFIWAVSDAAGATVGPVLLGRWLRYAEVSGVTWRFGYYAAAALLLALLFYGVGFHSERLRATTHGHAKSQTLQVMKGILSGPIIYLLGLAMFLHGLAQVGMVSWIGLLYRDRHEIDAAEAAYFISVNSAGFFIGRSLLAWILAQRKIPELLLLAICALGSTLAFVGTIMSPSYPTALVMFTLAGVFVSGNAPSINSYAGVRFAGRSAAAFALMIGIGKIGSAAGPYTSGLISTRFGLEIGIWFMPFFSLGLATIALIWFLRERVDRRFIL